MEEWDISGAAQADTGKRTSGPAPADPDPVNWTVLSSQHVHRASAPGRHYHFIQVDFVHLI